MNRGRTPVLAASVLVASWLVPGAAIRADDILFYLDDGRVVFTNTPSRGDAKPVPGLADRVRRVRGRLPATPWDRIIDAVARDTGLESDLVKAVAMVESGLDPSAVSPKGAMGLMQLMPATAEAYGVRDPLDPYQNLVGGARHLRDLLDRYDGDLTLALAAYNAGPTAVRRYGGVPAYAETQNYVKKVRRRLSGQRTRRAPARAPDEPLALEVQQDGSVVIRNQ